MNDPETPKYHHSDSCVVYECSGAARRRAEKTFSQLPRRLGHHRRRSEVGRQLRGSRRLAYRLAYHLAYRLRLHRRIS